MQFMIKIYIVILWEGEGISTRNIRLDILRVLYILRVSTAGIHLREKKRIIS